MSEYILAVDIGTSNVKCMIARPDMTVLAEADSEYETLCTGAGRYEQDPELWWRHMDPRAAGCRGEGQRAHG